MFKTTKKQFRLKFEEKRNGVRWYTLKNDLIYKHNLETFIVPAHLFYTDIASIPALFQKWFKPLGKYSRSSVLHDFICGLDHLSYFQKHWIYYQAMKEDSVQRWKAMLFFTSVFSFYWLHNLVSEDNEF